MLTALILAQDGGSSSSGSSSWSFLIIIVLFAFIFYFMLWRPQQKRMRSQVNLIESAKKGDEVVTQGGIYGFITELEDDTMLIEISEGVEIRIAKSSVGRNITAAERQAEAKTEKEKEEPEEEEKEETAVAKNEKKVADKELPEPEEESAGSEEDGKA
jgi:preprotein translocase subunit YajC